MQYYFSIWDWDKRLELSDRWMIFFEWLGPLMREAAGIYPTWLDNIGMADAIRKLREVIDKLEAYKATLSGLPRGEVEDAQTFLREVLEACEECKDNERAVLVVRLEQ